MELICGKEYRNYWMGISIILIIMLHLIYDRGTNDYIFKFLKMIFLQGDIGVNIFFFLSAYGLCYSYEHNSIKNFYKKRLKRIFPIYFVYLIFTMLYSTGLNIDINYLLIRLGGINIFQVDNARFADAWFMSALIFLYGIFPLLYHAVKRIQNKMALISGIIISITIIYYIPFSKNIILGMFLARFYIILLGIVTYFYIKNKQQNKLQKLYIITASLTFLTYNDCSFYFYVPLLLYAINESNIKLPMFKTFNTIGKYTLELYLAQIIFIQEFFLKMKGNYYIDAIICIICTIILAVALNVIQKYFWKGRDILIKSHK